MDDTPDITIPAPEQRLTLAGHEAAERRLRQLLDQEALSNGWMLSGPANVGKATLAYRIARAYLDRENLTDGHTLFTRESKTSHLVSQKAHPDLFVVERQWDEKKDRLVGEITVDTVRAMISFMSRTSGSGHRVAIVDSADDLNRNAANALLKVLEEPPANSLVILTTSAPGRLLPTIRSRCRVMTLKPLADEEMLDFLRREEAATGEDAPALVQAAGGRPGFALQLAAGEGADAIAATEAFLSAAISGRGLSAVAEKMALKSADAMWGSFKTVLLRQLALAASTLATGDELPANLKSLSGASPGALAKAWEAVADLITRSEALNTSRVQIVLGAGFTLRNMLKGG